MKYQQIDKIIAKSLKGCLSGEEQEIIKDWISQSAENKKEFEVYTQLWGKSMELVFSDTIDTESSLVKIKKQIAVSGIKKRWIIYLRQAAAVVLLSVSLTFLYDYLVNVEKPDEVPEQTVYHEIKAAFGSQTKLLLADGTNVWLNSGSSLRFPASFNDIEERRVELTGEGFFEVTKNVAKPFIVNTSEFDVKVYGTSFNVSAYNDYHTMTVALVEGKIGLVRKSNGGEKELMTLNPNEVVEYDFEERKLYHSTNQNMDKYTAWKNGYIMFDDDHIEKMVQRLEKWYNVEITISDKALQSYRFTATLIDKSLEQVLNLLCLSSQMKYTITPAQKQKDNSYSMCKVTLSFK